MQQRQVVVVAHLFGWTIDTDQLARQVRLGQPVGLGIPLPVAQAGDALRLLQPALCGFQFPQGALLAGHVLDRAILPQENAISIEPGVADLAHHSFFAVRQNDPAGKFVIGPAPFRRPHDLPDLLPVVGVDDRQKCVIGRRARAWLQPDDTVGFIGPPLFAGMRVPFPIADPCGLLRPFEALHGAGQLAGNPFAFGNVYAERQHGLHRAVLRQHDIVVPGDQDAAAVARLPLVPALAGQPAVRHVAKFRPGRFDLAPWQQRFPDASAAQLGGGISREVLTGLVELSDSSLRIERYEQNLIVFPQGRGDVVFQTARARYLVWILVGGDDASRNGPRVCAVRRAKGSFAEQTGDRKQQ